MINKQKQLVVYPSPVILPESCSVRRLAPRAVDLQQGDYGDKFDDRTVFFDIFSSDRGVELSGPPLLNLLPYISGGSIQPYSAGDSKVRLLDVDRTQDSFVTVDQPASLISIQNELFEEVAIVNSNLNDLFENKFTLVTLSKNNSLTWIREWVEFHVKNHGINAVLFYDNDSSDYSPEDVCKSLDGIQGLDVTVVVSWPFKYGPQGGTWESSTRAPWDSDFCQHGALSHARRRFLSRAAGVINADIDELIVAESGQGIFEILQAAPAAGLTYSGRWVESIRAESSMTPKFADFRYVDSRRNPCTKKWVASPLRMTNAGQWRTHDILGAEMVEIKDVSHRHFMGINSNWKHDRSLPVEYDENFHSVDVSLQGYIENAFSDDSVMVHAPDPHLMLKNVPTTLQDIEFVLITNDLLPESLLKSWYWKPTCLVFDISYFGLNLGFDLISTNLEFKLNVVGRNDYSKELLKVKMKQSGNLDVSGRGHWSIGSWLKSADPESIAKNIAKLLRNG